MAHALAGRVLCAAALAIPMLACAAADDGPRTERRDSAGIAIVEVSAPGRDADGGWIIDPDPAGVRQ